VLCRAFTTCLTWCLKVVRKVFHKGV